MAWTSLAFEFFCPWFTRSGFESLCKWQVGVGSCQPSDKLDAISFQRSSSLFVLHGYKCCRQPVFTCVLCRSHHRWLVNQVQFNTGERVMHRRPNEYLCSIHAWRTSIEPFVCRVGQHVVVAAYDFECFCFPRGDFRGNEMNGALFHRLRFSIRTR